MASSVVTAADFTVAADAFQSTCTVSILVQLAEENVATQPGPPVLAFQVPQTSMLSAIARPILAGFSRYLAEPQNAPLFYVCRDVGGKDPVAWSTPLCLLADTVVHELLVAAAKEQRDAAQRNQNMAVAVGGSAVQSATADASALLKRNPFPIKLYANFRPTKRNEVFPFHTPSSMTGTVLVQALQDNVLQCLKRSVAIMNVDKFKDFYSELNPQDMKRLKDFGLMDSPSMSVRTEFAQFHKGILATISIEAWPVMIHSLETGRTLTLAIPAHVKSGGRSFMHRSKAAAAAPAAVSAGGITLRGIQGSLVDSNSSNRRSVAGAAEAAATDATPAEALPETCFIDVINALATKMNPNHLPSTSDGQQLQEQLRRRLRVGGMPVAPPAEVPLRWLMEHAVGGDLCLHVLLLPFAL